MIYPNNFEDKIEFSAIRSYIEGYCVSNLGKDKLKSVRFSDNIDEIKIQLNQTAEFVEILTTDEFPELAIYDLRSELKRIRINETYLSSQDLLQLYKSLMTIETVIRFLNKTKESSKADDYKYPHLRLLLEGRKRFPELCQSIMHIINEFGDIKDSASKELNQIRRDKSAAERNVSRVLQTILRKAQSEGIVDNNVSPSMRDGRLVIPVIPAHKRKINGIVHDESDTGKTIFIEPTEVVEANNRISELENEERKEIIRILKAITSEIRPHVPDIQDSFALLADIDFIRSKAKFSILTEAKVPEIHPTPLLFWNHAIHPLLKIILDRKNLGNQAEKQQVVPLDIKLEEPKQRILIISGPNAGGKSVCLKTVGLLQYMLQCGFPIPVGADSVCGIFHDIFINIGDEQSIENELSTFSSHLINMKAMMKHSNNHSLLLIDEFGGGTEPMIGGALAQAMLKKLNNNKVFAVITTHFQNLKHYAQESEGVVNAAMLYDRNEMRPLFQLRIGTPGSSFAVEIARKIGVPSDVIADATKIVGADYISSEKYIQDIIRDKRYWENKRMEIHQKEKKMDAAIAKYEADINRLKEEKRQIIDKAKMEAQSMLDSSNSIIERTIKEIKEAQAEKERTKSLRSDLEEYKSEVKSKVADELDEYIQRKVDKIKRRQQRKAEKQSKENSRNGAIPAKTSSASSESDRQFHEGDYVRLEQQQTIGKILKIGMNKDATVMFGSIQMVVKLARLHPSPPPTQERRAITFVSKQTQDSIRETTLNFKSEIDVRGMRAEEAIQAITYFIDDAQVASVHNLRILHGTGNGILRTVIRQYLSTVRAVISMRDEHPQFGGTGITIVKLE